MTTVFQRVGPYEILKEIGRGGQGARLRAPHARPTRPVAQKHVPNNRYGLEDSGDHSFYNGIGYNSAQRVAGPSFPLARSLTETSNGYQDKFGGAHTGIVMFALSDGSVRALRTSIDSINLQRLAMRNDGQVITLND